MSLPLLTAQGRVANAPAAGRYKEQVKQKQICLERFLPYEWRGDNLSASIAKWRNAAIFLCFLQVFCSFAGFASYFMRKVTKNNTRALKVTLACYCTNSCSEQDHSFRKRACLRALLGGTLRSSKSAVQGYSRARDDYNRRIRSVFRVPAH